jgi:membrane fusion protein (multidrug efflux system)
MAEARWKERAVLSPTTGTVASIRTRAGQQLNPGDVALTIVDPQNATFSAVALVPGEFRPLLKPGMPMRLELIGYPHVYQTLEIESIGADVVGPTEIRRYLGPELADTVPLQGSLVVVRGRLKQEKFVADGKQYPYYDGIPARIEVKIRTLRLLVMLFPAIKGMFDHGV